MVQPWSRSVLMALVLTLCLTGCGRKRSDSGAEGEEGATQADTATIDSGGSAEALPTIDQGAEGQASAPAPAQDTPSVPVAEASAPAEVAKTDSAAPSAPAATDSAGTAPTPTPSHSEFQGSGQTGTYTVQKGDTLMKIAFQVYGDITRWRAIYEANRGRLSDANQLSAGTQLSYEKPATEPLLEKNGDPYQIKKGDTLGSIAYELYAKRSYWRKLFENNRTLIKDPNKIYAGFYLYYQISEQERQEAERIKGGSGGEAPLSRAAAPSRSVASSKASRPTAPQSNAPSNQGSGGLGGLSGLSSGNRAGTTTSAPAPVQSR